MASINEAAKKISEMGNRTEALKHKFSSIDSIETDSTIKEEELRKQIQPREPGKVAGVDGGLVKKRYSAGDMVGTRAVAAVFNFSSELEVNYIPSKRPEPSFEVFGAQDANSLEKRAETERVRAEINTVSEAIDRSELVLVDGSIVPSYLGNEEVLKNYEDVFEKVEKGALAGVVEDSYGLKLSKMLEEKLGLELGKVRDTIIMDAILEEGERSFVRRYSDSPVEHPVLQSLRDKHVNRIHTFYVKLSSKDLPLRIDYYGDEEDADRLAGVLYSIKASDWYTVPSPLVEADKRAKIPEKYLKRLEKRFSPDLRRRDRRSF